MGNDSQGELYHSVVFVPSIRKDPRSTHSEVFSLTQSEQNQCRKCSTDLFCSRTILRLLRIKVKFPQSIRLVARHPIVEERNFHLTLGVLYFPAISSGSVTARRDYCGVEFVHSVDDGVGGVDDSGGLFKFYVEGVVAEFFFGVVDVGEVGADCGLVAPGYFGSRVVDVESSPRINPKGFPSKTTYISKEMQDLRYHQRKG